MTVGDVLLHVLIVLVAAKVAAEGAERLKLPAVVGEIVAGVVIGPSLLGLVGSDEVLRTLGELGVILLLLEVGMEMDLGELGAVGRASLLVAAVAWCAVRGRSRGDGGVRGGPHHLDLRGGRPHRHQRGHHGPGVRRPSGTGQCRARTVLGAAVADDVMGLVILTVVVRVVSEGGPCRPPRWSG